MTIQLSDHFTYKRLIRFVLPSIIMMIFTSIYGVVDGLFVSNFAGKTPFAAVNLIMPFLILLGSLGFMFGTGGSAIIAQTLGEGKPQKANEYFSMILYAVIGCGLLLTIVGLLLLRPVAMAFGAQGAMLEYCVLYGRIILVTLIPFMMQNVFQSFFVTAEKPQLGLAITVLAGLTNMFLDFVFIALFDWGIVGAALATAISQIVGGIIPLFYFLMPNTSKLRLCKTKLNKAILLKTCINGSSELMTNVSMSLINILYNFQLMHYIGEDGIAAYGVIMYVNFIFAAIFIGYSIGSAPVISYHYGAGNYGELKGLYQKSLFLIALSDGFLTLSAIALSGPLVQIFVGYDDALATLTTHGFCLYSLSFLVMGFNIFGSAFFTALGNGLISALISFLRTLLFQIVAVMVMPLLFDLNGIWLAVVAAELMTLLMTIYFFVKNKIRYHYN